MEIEAIRFDLEDVTTRLLDVFGQQAQDKGLLLHFDFPAVVPSSLLGDPLRLQLVLANLVSNALKFTEEGAVSITGRVRGRPADQAELEYEVRDTGIGMSAEEAARVFTAFSPDGSTTRRFGGTGLGLAISQQLVALMGGEIRVESQPGQGSLFAFSVAFGVVAVQPTAATPLPTCLARSRILVVGAQDQVRTLSRQLTQLAFRVTAAATADQALACLAQSPADDPYRLIVIDWCLAGAPDALDAQTYHALRAAQPLADPPRIMVVSSYWNQQLSEDIESDRVDAFLPRPFTFSTLHDTIVDQFPEEAAAVAAANRHAAPDLHGVRLLLAEDNEINQEVASGLLAETGCTLTVVSNGIEAAEAAAGGGFDLVLMDLQMPELDGLAATQRIRRLEAADQRPRMPIIAMTANAMADDRREALAAGMDDHLGKPVDPEELYRLLADWTGASGRQPRGRILPEEDAGINQLTAHETDGAVDRWLALATSQDVPEVAAPAADAPDEPVLEVAAAVRRLCGKPALYCKLLRKFVATFPRATRRSGPTSPAAPFQGRGGPGAGRQQGRLPGIRAEERPCRGRRAHGVPAPARRGRGRGRRHGRRHGRARAGTGLTATVGLADGPDCTRQNPDTGYLYSSQSVVIRS